MTPREEREARRLKKAKEAQAAARRRRAEEARLAEESLARHLAGTAWPDPSAEPQPLSATERSKRFRAKGRELDELPPVRHRRVRESCRLDLLRFGKLYCADAYEGMKPLLKRPPSPRMEGFVRALQDKILNGGLKHVRWPRGKGKSTWVKIAIIWASLYGHRFFSVVVEKTKGMAFIVVEEIWKRITLSPLLAADFPEFAEPMRDVSLTPQRMRVQTYHGKPTYMKQDVSRFHYFKLPTMDGHPNTGAIIAYRGSEQALRGINIESARPDFFFIDDPQTAEDAANPRTVEKIEANITGAVLGSGEINERISAVMASTAIEPDDVSETFAHPEKHPEWQTDTERLVVSFGPRELMAEYLRRLAADEPAAHKWYRDNRAAIEQGAEMMDDGDFDPVHEASAYEHALYLLHTMKQTSFHAEYQMTPARSQGIYKISSKTVTSRVNAAPFGVVPAACDRGLLAFCDVNAEAGLRWEIAAFGKGRVVATLAYGQYPAEGQRLYPAGTPESAVPAYLAAGLRRVAEVIMSHRFRVAGTDATVSCGGICFDGGWQTETVASTVADLTAHGVTSVWSKGFDSRNYSARHHEMAASGKIECTLPDGRKTKLKAAECCHQWQTANGVFLAFNADYWKEVSQTSYLAEPLSPSSSSFYGSEPAVHNQFAQEICNEELAAKDRSVKYGTIYVWRKSKSRPNHYGDVHAGVMAYGAIRAYFDPLASVISSDDLAKNAMRKRKPRYVYKP